MKDRKENDKSTLSIHLLEPTVYLKSADVSGRRRARNEHPQPSAIRGVLALHLSEPRKIYSIGIELTAKSYIRLPHSNQPPEERQLYSSSTIYFRGEKEGHRPRRSTSLNPSSSMATPMWEDDASFFDLPVLPEDVESSHVQERTSDHLAGRRGASVDLHNFRPDIVSHHATSRFPSPEYFPSFESTSEESPTSSSSSTQLTPPPDPESPPLPGPVSHAQSNPQRDYRFPVHTENSVSPPPPASRGRTSQALALDLTVPPTQLTPPREPYIASPAVSQLPQNLSNEESSRFPPSSTLAGPSDDTWSRRKRFSSPSTSDASQGRTRSCSKGRTEGTSIAPDAHDYIDKGGETGRGRTRKRNSFGLDLSHTLVKVSEVLGLENEEGREPREGWKEFKKGTYRYPISFAIPADSPPSLDCTFGSIVWIMTATVHRPGRLVPRMKAVHTINVVATPGDDATDENLNVTQTWKRQTGDDQMAYSLSVFGKTFPIGSKIPIQIKLLPFVTVKVHRVSVAIDEHVTYNRAVELPQATQHLLRLEHPGRGLTPILPLSPEDLKSPLYSLVQKDLRYTDQSWEERALELRNEWAGPGPWSLRFEVKIPDICRALHPTNTNKKGRINVSHTLRITIRVESGNHLADGRGRGTMFDLIIKCPINLLSPLCSNKYTSLPSYSPAWRTVPPPSGQASSSETGPSTIVLEVVATEMEQLTHQFEQLITGQVTETGEFPPSYESDESV